MQWVSLIIPQISKGFFFPWLDGFWHFNKVSIYLYISDSIAYFRHSLIVERGRKIHEGRKKCFPGVQLNPLPTYCCTLLYERLEQATNSYLVSSEE